MSSNEITGKKKQVERLPSMAPRGTNTVRTLLGAKDLDIDRNAEAFNVPIEKIEPNPKQPRKKYDPEQDAELVESVKAQGILQPLIVRKVDGGKYQIVAGERRFRAATQAGLTQLPVIIKNYDDRQVQIVSLIENLQRSNLDPLDEKNYFLELQNTFNLSVSDIANLIGKSRGYVRNRLENNIQSLQPEPIELKVNDQVSEENNNVAHQANSLENSQPIGEVAAKPAKFNAGYFKKFSQVIDTTILVLEQKPDAKVQEQIKQSVLDMEQRLAELKQKLGL